MSQVGTSFYISQRTYCNNEERQHAHVIYNYFLVELTLADTSRSHKCL